ncbi:unnamed protein product, partial [Closterium sp. Naga37s-1]
MLRGNILLVMLRGNILLRGHTVGDAEREHTVGDAEREHTVGEAEREHTVGEAEREHTVGEAEREHTVGEAEREHTVGEAEREHTVGETGGLCAWLAVLAGSSPQEAIDDVFSLSHGASFPPSAFRAKSTDEALAASFGATFFPALFLHKADGTRQLYDGPLKPEPIAAFLEQFAAPAEPVADSATAGEAEAGRAGSAGEEGLSRWVRQMRGANFSSQVLQREEMWMVALASSSEECREVKEEFEKTAEEIVGMCLYFPANNFAGFSWQCRVVACACI